MHRAGQTETDIILEQKPDLLNDDRIVYDKKTGEVTSLDEQLEKIMQDHRRTHKKKQLPGLDYIDPQYLGTQTKQLEAIFGVGEFKKKP